MKSKYLKQAVLLLGLVLLFTASAQATEYGIGKEALSGFSKDCDRMSKEVDRMSERVSRGSERSGNDHCDKFTGDKNRVCRSVEAEAKASSVFWGGYGQSAVDGAMSGCAWGAAGGAATGAMGGGLGAAVGAGIGCLSGGASGAVHGFVEHGIKATRELTSRESNTDVSSNCSVTPPTTRRYRSLPELPGSKR